MRVASSLPIGAIRLGKRYVPPARTVLAGGDAAGILLDRLPLA